MFVDAMGRASEDMVLRSTRNNSKLFQPFQRVWMIWNADTHLYFCKHYSACNGLIVFEPYTTDTEAHRRLNHLMAPWAQMPLTRSFHVFVVRLLTKQQG